MSAVIDYTVNQQVSLQVSFNRSETVAAWKEGNLRVRIRFGRQSAVVLNI